MDRPKLLLELERDEGLRLHPYTDTVGKITIGIGRNLTDVGLSKEEVYALAGSDIYMACGDLDHYLPWWNRLSEVRQRVLANMVFNMGIRRLQGFALFLNAVQIGDWEEAAKQMLDSQWARQVGPRATRLAEQMRKGYEV